MTGRRRTAIQFDKYNVSEEIGKDAPAKAPAAAAISYRPSSASPVSLSEPCTSTKRSMDAQRMIGS